MAQPRGLGVLMSGCDTAHPSLCGPGLAGRPGGLAVGLVPVGMLRMGRAGGAGMHRHSSGAVSNFTWCHQPTCVAQAPRHGRLKVLGSVGVPEGRCRKPRRLSLGNKGL